MIFIQDFFYSQASVSNVISIQNLWQETFLWNWKSLIGGFQTQSVFILHELTKFQFMFLWVVASYLAQLFCFWRTISKISFGNDLTWNKIMNQAILSIYVCNFIHMLVSVALLHALDQRTGWETLSPLMRSL